MPVVIAFRDTFFAFIYLLLFFSASQGEPCVMGQKQIYMKRRPGNHCMLGRDYARVLSAEPCICRAHDFEW